MKRIPEYKHILLSINRRSGEVEKVLSDLYPYRSHREDGKVLLMDFPVTPGKNGTRWIDTKYYERLTWRMKNDRELIDKKNEVLLNYPAKGEPKNLLLDMVELKALKRAALSHTCSNHNRLKARKKKERKKAREFLKQSEKRLLKQIYKDCPQVFDKNNPDRPDRDKTIEELEFFWTEKN